MSRRGLLLLLLASAPARAQDAPDVVPGGVPTPVQPPDGPPDTAPPAPALPPEPLGERFVWERRGRIGERVADVDVQPIPAGAWIAVDERGGVWLSEDEGRRWENVVRPIGGLEEAGALPDEEDILLEAESRRDDALDDVDVDDVDQDDFVPAGEEVEVEVDVPDPDDAAIEEATELATALATREAEGPATLPLVWVDPTSVDTVFAARADGLWRSTNGGRTWEHTRVAELGDPAVTDLYRTADGTLLVGTTDGVRHSTDDGVTWIDVQDATDGVRVNDLVGEDGYVFAATDTALFRSVNGLSWESIPLPGVDPVRTVVADPAWDGGFWVATEGALYRTDDGGATFYVAGRQPLRGLRGMVHLDEAGHLLAISSEGVWESMDGGVTWSTADRHLAEPDVRSLAFTDAGPVIATPTGVWWMVAPRTATRPARKQEVLSLTDTIAAATHRDGMDLDLLSLSKLGVVAKFAPALELVFDWSGGAGREANYSSANTVDDHPNDWTLGLRFCWGGCGSTLGFSGDSYDAAEVYSDYDLYAIGGNVYDEGEPVAAAANVAQSIRSYRRYVADHVADAWLARVRLVAETPAVRTLPLRDQVLHAVQIQELDARLDALTNGAFTASNAPSTRPEESP